MDPETFKPRHHERKQFAHYRSPSLKPAGAPMTEDIKLAVLEWDISWGEPGTPWAAVLMSRDYAELVQFDAPTQERLYEKIEAFGTGVSCERHR